MLVEVSGNLDRVWGGDEVECVNNKIKSKTDVYQYLLVFFLA